MIAVILSNILMYTYLYVYTHYDFIFKNTILSCSLLLLLNIIWRANVRKVTEVKNAFRLLVTLFISYSVSMVLTSIFIIRLGFFKTIREMIFVGIIYVLVGLLSFIRITVQNFND